MGKKSKRSKVTMKQPVKGGNNVAVHHGFSNRGLF
jgi:hypothetical protein